ncbi:MAG: PhoU domain-containing protein [Candidatus Helarchaeota archaeon]
MEQRKVQITGGSSFVITLPKEWINRNNIRPKDTLGMIIQPDDTILITPKNIKNHKYKEKSFDLDKISDPSYLFRLLIGAYMMGYSSIIVSSKIRIKPELKSSVKKFVYDAIGLEIMDEDNQMIQIKDLINPSEMPFENTIKRLFSKVKTMHEDTLNALSSKNKELANEIVERDDEVDRLYWSVARQSNLILRNTVIAKELGVEPVDANFFYLISRIIERIGDHAVNIAKNIPVIIDSNLNESIINKIKEAGQLALDIFSDSISVWFDKNIENANKIIESINKLHKLCDEINSIAVGTEGITAIAISYIIESIRRTGDYSMNICETTINQYIENF